MSAEGHYVGDESDLSKNGDRIIVDIEGREIAVFRVENEYHALLNYCVHAGGPLCEGPITGQSEVDDDGTWIYDEDEQVVSCPWHAWRFDITSGENIHDDRYAVPKYNVDVEDGRIFVRLRD